jgi:hypothetical protein
MLNVKRLEAGLEAYANHVKKQIKAAQAAVTIDPRTDQERQQEAEALAARQESTCEKPPPVDGESRFMNECDRFDIALISNA